MSRGDLFLLVIVLAAGGVADAAYLTWQWYAEASASFCDINAYFSCSRVRESVFSSVAGVPTAAIGLAGFLILAILAVIALRGRGSLGGFRVESLLLGFAILGALLGAGLSILEVFVIEAVCLLCALGFGLDLVVVAIAAGLRRDASQHA